MSSNRHTIPEILSGATEFSSEPELLGPLWAVRKLKQQPQWLSLLEDGTDLNRNWGRPRASGSWALAYLAFVVSGRSDVEPWAASVSDEVWRECGFSSPPSYQTVWLRFAELEAVEETFAGVAARLIRHARVHSNGRVGRDIHVDGTESETNAKLHHACPKTKSCPKSSRIKQLRPDEAREFRHQDDAAPIDSATPPADQEIDSNELLLHVGKCVYRSLDETAGVRAYARGDQVKRFWHGFYNAKAIDHYTGAPIAVMVTSASEQEYHAYPRLLEQTCKALDDTPRSVVADKGYSFDQVFELNTRNGIASVMPYRPRHQTMRKRRDEDEYDRHGIPRCKHCGGQSKFVRFAHKPYPRLWFECLEGRTDGCAKTQSIACSKNWRSLVPLWILEPAYFALRDSHQIYERVHNHWRTRYRVGAATHEMRPKRRGLKCQQLRANAALLIEWLRILDREGWLGSARRNRRNRKPTKVPVDILQRIRETRAKYGIQLPYGPKAVELGIGPMRPGEPPPGPAPPDQAPVPF